MKDKRGCPSSRDLGQRVVTVRAERAGGAFVAGNGRVSHLSFTVNDGHGGGCSGSVLVGVRHHPSRAAAVDDGLLYDSTVA